MLHQDNIFDTLSILCWVSFRFWLAIEENTSLITYQKNFPKKILKNFKLQRLALYKQQLDWYTLWYTLILTLVHSWYTIDM
jgi:hypothetical protein